jgi:hypothetical protein
MRTQQTGIGGLQLLLFTATFMTLSFVVGPEYSDPGNAEQTMAAKAELAKALDYADESRHKIAQSFQASHSLPRTAREVYAMKPTTASKPESVRQVKFQHDYAGETVMIMVYLNNGVAERFMAGEQYVYIAGIKSREDDGSVEWQCGGRNVDLFLLPEECRRG